MLHITHLLHVIYIELHFSVYLSYAIDYHVLLCIFLIYSNFHNGQFIAALPTNELIKSLLGRRSRGGGRKVVLSCGCFVGGVQRDKLLHSRCHKTCPV